MKPWKAKLILLGGTTIWGATFLFTTLGIRNCSPSLYLVFRFSIALLLCFIFFGKHIVQATQQTKKCGILLGIFFAVGFLLQTFGLKYTSIGNTAFITNLCVIITPFIYWFLSREKIQIYSKISVIIGLLGLYIITNPTGTAFNIGDVLVVISTLCWALYMSYLHIFTKGTSNFALNAQLVAFQFVGGLPIIVAYLLIFDITTVFITFNTELLVSVLFNSIMASFLVSFLQISYQKYTTPASAALIFAMEPIFATIISFFVLSEVLSTNGYIGAGLLFIAIFVSDTLGGIIKKFKIVKNKNYN